MPGPGQPLIQPGWYGRHTAEAPVTAPSEPPNSVLLRSFFYSRSPISHLLPRQLPPSANTPAEYNAVNMSAPVIPPGGTIVQTFKKSFVDVPIDEANGRAVATSEFLEAAESLTTIFGTPLMRLHLGHGSQLRREDGR